MDGVRYTKPVRAVDDIKYLTVQDQQKFMEAAKRSHNYYQYALLLETGLRTGELVGLTWDAIDWEKRTLTINKTLEYRHKPVSYTHLDVYKRQEYSFFKPYSFYIHLFIEERLFCRRGQKLPNPDTHSKGGDAYAAQPIPSNRSIPIFRFLSSSPAAEHDCLTV